MVLNNLTGHNNIKYAETMPANPNMSANTEIEGQFYFNKKTIAPPGIKVIVHEKPQQHKTWGVYGVPGCYIGPAMEH